MYITLKFRQAKDVYNNNSLITGGGLTAKFRKSPYLCNVFFIVLDFKVNKGWSTAVLLFLCPYFKYQISIKTLQTTLFTLTGTSSFIFTLG